jgi:hypothetical protein
MDELLKSIFLRAQEQYESATRWVFIIVLICILFHLMTFGQFVSFEKQLAGTKDEQTRLTELNDASSDLKANLTNLNGYVIRPLKGRLDALLSDLRSDFEALDRSVAQIRTPATLEFTTSQADRLLERETPADSQMRVQEAVREIRKPLKQFELGEELGQEIKAAATVDELREVLVPVIENQVIGQRFNQINSYWQRENLPKIKERIEAIRQKVQESKARFPEETAFWDTILESLNQTEQAGGELEFRPPKDPDWWATVSGKEAKLASIGEAAEKQISEAVEKSKAIDTLSEKVKAALDQQKAMQNRLEDSLRQLEKNFKEQQTKLADLSKPFGMLSFDLAALVQRFPLLLGIILAATIIWPAYRLREFALAADLMARQGEGKVAWRWFLSRTRYSFSTPLESGPADEAGVDEPSRAIRPRIPGIVLPGLIYWIWIAIAAWELSGWKDVNPLTLIASTVGGFFAVAAAQVYRFSIMR